MIEIGEDPQIPYPPLDGRANPALTFDGRAVFGLNQVDQIRRQEPVPDPDTEQYDQSESCSNEVESRVREVQEVQRIVGLGCRIT